MELHRKLSLKEIRDLHAKEYGSQTLPNEDGLTPSNIKNIMIEKLLKKDGYTLRPGTRKSYNDPSNKKTGKAGRPRTDRTRVCTPVKPGEMDSKVKAQGEECYRKATALESRRKKSKEKTKPIDDMSKDELLGLAKKKISTIRRKLPNAPNITGRLGFNTLLNILRDAGISRG